MIDDGPWAGVPIGGMGAGSIGRTQRGDFARWHLDVGPHRFESDRGEPVLAVRRAGRRRRRRGPRPLDDPARRAPVWGWDLPVGAGTYHALFPYAWYDVDWAELPVRVVQRQFSPVIAGDYRESSLPVGVFEMAIENPVRRAADGRADVQLAERRWAARAVSTVAGGQRHEAVRRDGLAGVVLGGPGAAARDGRRRHVRAARRRGAGRRAPATPLFEVADGAAGLWADFATDGRLSPVDGSGRRPRRPAGRSAARSPRRSRWPPASRGRSRSSSPGTSRRRSSRPGRAGHAATRRSSGRPGGTPGPIAAEGARCREEWAAAIEAWQAPILADPARPDWYKARALQRALLHGRRRHALDRRPAVLPERPTARRRRPARPTPAARSAGSPRSSASTTRSTTRSTSTSTRRSRVLQLWPELERGGHPRRSSPRSPSTTRRSSRSRERQARAAEVPPARCPTTSAGRLDDPLLRVNAYHYQDINIWKDLNCKFVLQALARRDGPGRRRRCSATRGRRSSGRSSTSPRSTATATGCPSTTATPTRPTTRGR